MTKQNVVTTEDMINALLEATSGEDRVALQNAFNTLQVKKKMTLLTSAMNSKSPKAAKQIVDILQQMMINVKMYVPKEKEAELFPLFNDYVETLQTRNSTLAAVFEKEQAKKPVKSNEDVKMNTAQQAANTPAHVEQVADSVTPAAKKPAGKKAAKPVAEAKPATAAKKPAAKKVAAKPAVKQLPEKTLNVQGKPLEEVALSPLAVALEKKMAAKGKPATSVAKPAAKKAAAKPAVKPAAKAAKPVAEAITPAVVPPVVAAAVEAIIEEAPLPTTTVGEVLVSVDAAKVIENNFVEALKATAATGIVLADLMTAAGLVPKKRVLAKAMKNANAKTIIDLEVEVRNVVVAAALSGKINAEVSTAFAAFDSEFKKFAELQLALITAEERVAEQSLEVSIIDTAKAEIADGVKHIQEVAANATAEVVEKLKGTATETATGAIEAAKDAVIEGIEGAGEKLKDAADKILGGKPADESAETPADKDAKAKDGKKGKQKEEKVAVVLSLDDILTQNRGTMTRQLQLAQRERKGFFGRLFG